MRALIEHNADININLGVIDNNSEETIECDHGNKDNLNKFLKERENDFYKSEHSSLPLDLWVCQMINV